MSGYGYGDGDGDGDGYGYGYGYGYGDGDGDGYGYGDEYRLATIPYLSTRWTDSQQKRLKEVQKEGATLAFWRSNLDGTPSNGGRGGARKTGDVEKIPGPLELCGARALHATTKVSAWKGAKVWVVALFGEIARSENGDKLGALHREILGEAWREE